jgi:hypothetical protein
MREWALGSLAYAGLILTIIVGGDVANVQGNVTIQSISDGDMIKIYAFKEKHGSNFTFHLSTGMGGQQNGPPQITLSWTKLEGAEAVVALMKELESKPKA